MSRPCGSWLKWLALALAIGLFAADARAETPQQGESAEAVVTLYYLLGGRTASESQIKNGVPVVLDWFKQGHGEPALTDAVIQACKEVPGTRTAAFEVIMPSYLAAHLRSDGEPPPEPPAPVVEETHQESPSDATNKSEDEAPKNLFTNFTTPPATAGQQVRTDHYKAGMGGLITGAVFDLIGYAMVLAGGMLASEIGIGVTAGLMGVGSGVAMIGGIIGTISMGARHQAFVNAGYAPSSGPRAGSVVLLILTCVTFGAAMPMPILPGIILAGTSIILEIINFATRLKGWENALKTAPLASAARAPRHRVQVVPYAAPLVETGSARLRRPGGLVGVAVVF